MSLHWRYVLKRQFQLKETHQRAGKVRPTCGSWNLMLGKKVL